MTEPSNPNSLSTTLFRHCDRNLVLFAYTREVDEDPPQEISNSSLTQWYCSRPASAIIKSLKKTEWRSYSAV